MNEKLGLLSLNLCQRCQVAEMEQKPSQKQNLSLKCQVTNSKCWSEWKHGKGTKQCLTASASAVGTISMFLNLFRRYSAFFLILSSPVNLVHWKKEKYTQVEVNLKNFLKALNWHVMTVRWATMEQESTNWKCCDSHN